MMDHACTYPLGFLRRDCGREAVSACVYCGEPFCADHGVRGADYQDVCKRRACAAKLEDLELHLVWRVQVSHANRVSICAVLECSERMRHACSQCRLLFCEIHVREHDVKDTRVLPARKVRALVCAHCLERRKIWE
jgi:hypothetical protein